MSNVDERVIKVIGEAVNTGIVVQKGMTLNELGYDSLKNVELVVLLEEEFNILLRCSYVENCVAYGVKCNATEQIHVDIVLKQVVTESELWKLLSEILPGHLLPDKIAVVDVLKRNASGKLVRGDKSLQDK